MNQYYSTCFLLHILFVGLGYGNSCVSRLTDPPKPISGFYGGNRSTIGLCSYEFEAPANTKVTLNVAFSQNSFHRVIFFEGQDCLSIRSSHLYNPEKRTPYVFQSNKASMLVIVDTTSLNITGEFNKENINTNNNNNKITDNNSANDPKKLHDIEKCGESLQKPKGTISNEDPTNVLKEKLCIWRLMPTSKKQVRLNILKFSASTPGDGLWILDGSDCSSSIVLHKNNHSYPVQSTVTSTKGALTVLLRRTFSPFPATFSAEFEEQTDSNPIDPSGPNQTGTTTNGGFAKPNAIFDANIFTYTSLLFLRLMFW